MQDDESQPEQNNRSRWAQLCRVALVGYWLALFIATHVPSPIPLESQGWSYDKFIHLGAYFVLGTLMLAWRRSTGARVGWRTRLAILAILALYGAVDELTQPLVGRVCDRLDWFADLAGALAAMTLDRWRNDPRSLTRG